MIKTVMTQTPVELIYSVYDPPHPCRRFDAGEVGIYIGSRCFTFHPLEWNPSRELDKRNPWHCVPVSLDRVRDAEEIKARLEEAHGAWDATKSEEAVSAVLERPFSFEQEAK